MKNRNGSYKKILISKDQLEVQSDFLHANIQALKALKLTDHDFTTLYIMLYLRLKHPLNWLAPKKSVQPFSNAQSHPMLLDLIPESFKLTDWEKEKLHSLSGLDLFYSYSLKSLPESIHRAMHNWYQKKWNIHRLEHIPSALELLNLQVNNARCITTVVKNHQLDQLVLGVRDPLSFVIHDLMHADQFFNHPESISGQLGFYQRISELYKKEEITALLNNDPIFKKEFEYVSSDMNAYVIHLFKCLKSAIARVDQKEEIFERVLMWWNMNSEQKRASFKLNTPQFSIDEELCLKNFFESSQNIYQEISQEIYQEISQ